MELPNSARACEAGRVVAQHWSDNFAEIIYRGRLTAQLVSQAYAELEPSLRDNPRFGVLINTVEVTSVDPGLVAATRHMVEHYKRYPGLRLAAVIPSVALRMTAQAIMFGSGLPMRIFPTRRDAFAYLRG